MLSLLDTFKNEVFDIESGDTYVALCGIFLFEDIQVFISCKMHDGRMRIRRRRERSDIQFSVERSTHHTPGVIV